MKPILYSPTDTDFEAGGIGVLVDCKKCLVTEEGNGAYTAELAFPINAKYSEQLEDHNYQIKCKPNAEDNYHIFYIYNHYKDMATGVLYVYAKSRTMKLGNRAVKKLTFERATCEEAMGHLEKAMDQQSDIRLFSNITRVGSTSIEVTNPLQCIKGIDGSFNQIYGGEMKHEPFKLSLLSRRGKDHVTTFRYRKNLSGLKVDINFDGLLTRVFPYADVQNNEGQTERIYGNKVDSPYINHYDGEIYSEYVQFTEEQGVTNQTSLNNVAKKYFSSLNPNCDKPKVSIELNIRKMEDSALAKRFKSFRTIGLFDTFDVFHERYNIKITAQVTKIVYDSLAERVESLEAGDTKYTFFEKQKQEIAETLKGYTGKQYASNFIDVVTNIISGNDGGHVIWWPKNRPTDLFFCDNAKLEKAKLVLRINKSGIGFSSKGWQGPFSTAWTLDGKFNANFIKTGIIDANVFQNSFNKTGDVLRLVNGLLEIRNNSKKIMQLTKKGMEFWNGNSHVGTMGTKGNPFPGLVDKNGNPVISDGNSLLLVADNPQKIIGLSNQKGAGHIITGLTQLFVGNNFNFFGPEGSKATITVDRLIVGGKEVIPGDGSGGNDGDVPPELTTEKEKNAWAVWQFLKSKGYSEQAAAGILGNMDQESGIMPDIDEGGGGPGYGLVQWTSPIAGESGRAYVQRLLGQAGISGDYRNITTQLKLLDWHMHNGQYIPSAAYPYSVAEFKALTDIGTATMAFEANFERPAVTHPERIPMAQYWYDLLHNLKPGTNKWVNPVRSSYTITQEWDEIGWGTNVIHGGIDIASMPAGSMPPVYVARSGTVETVTYDGTGGNYVVIKHDDGYWTYYGHLDSVDLSVGDKVTTNSRVGIMGATGLASGVHLHFEVWKGAQWQRINPRDVINF
ncbi:peptidoglycan DD-metalloendopeptidase family protein [Enterococcus faecalis]|uniref:phage tail spike protein n=2 Tax=Enterococcus faecalis TaxID=1351 RepID=UPI000CF32722|nr:phage tail spike protein [Enterococcus faecalis]EHG5971109.1 peptidoglycan DD-metalloendopeptidase family protein [Enterococcus faecalis]EHK9430574.1 peptidoglycan DD-metalloendopeptidase family protein [Enterococcus faecalis]EHV2913552.1 peptidoglycan DD-metalloendopeptidase family protein [Enterococcus faecalis]EIQ7148208.1 peptidoglycan DD-metalloendopeptidase family protein [Enterococcus faecalis]EME6194453.1 peptidoglycan DD-metalloendopeptidase family protein [Enterococcus faecalis]